ncbi:aldo/keto reductase [Streptomyces europaeiscabiei]|uniref:aldo/keto reductase n=1 Tax=Streptomyces europaeiscabiei TaxID=146819 RepID=UPI000AC4ED93|nr:aldo/keto reductase [Streptomyces europaeiscabiei]MDX2775306.1 aldo/keto reductase [Streptomyces europaeiscabiei]
MTVPQAVVGGSLAPQYVRWQTGRNGEQLGRERLDLVLLHNPERAHPGDRLALHRAMREAFVVLEEAVAAGRVAGYGIATWAGLEEEAFTVGELLALAAEAAGGRHHLVAVQMPVSLVRRSRRPFTAGARSRPPPARACGRWPPLRCTAASSPAWSTRSAPTSYARAWPPHRRVSRRP